MSSGRSVVSDPEIRYSFRVPNTDLWKSGTVTTGRGVIESVTRRIAELPDDATYRDRLAATKRRQIVELACLQTRRSGGGGSKGLTRNLSSPRRGPSR